MIRTRLQAVLDARGETAYVLAKRAGLGLTVVYRFADPALSQGMPSRKTLDRLCAVLGVQVGELMEWVPGDEPPLDGPRRPRGRPRKAVAGAGTKGKRR